MSTDALLYLDSSALVKLVVPEAESAALVELLVDWPARVTSHVAVVEVVRAARRASHDKAVHRRAREVMAAVNLIRLNGDVMQQATTLQPTVLCSLDAIHLASATSLADDIGAFVAYDRTLSAAAAAAGFRILAPGL